MMSKYGLACLLMMMCQAVFALAPSVTRSNKTNGPYTNGNGDVHVADSSQLKIEFCEECDFFLGGLFPIHAPKYFRHRSSSSPSIASHSESNNNTTTTTATTNGSATTSSPNFLLINKASTSVLSSSTPRSSHSHSDPPLDFSNEFYEYYIKSIGCGEIKKERGIQRLEALLYAIDLINNSTSLLPHTKLGVRIYDTCDRDTIALEKCVNFISDYFVLNKQDISSDYSCQAPTPTPADDSGCRVAAGSSPLVPRKNIEAINKRKVVGVIGAASSSVSIQVANLLRLFQVPQLSYASTSPELSNKERFPFFSRVLPSDTLQAEAMATLVHHLDWNYVATLSEEGNLGMLR